MSVDHSRTDCPECEDYLACVICGHDVTTDELVPAAKLAEAESKAQAAQQALEETREDHKRFLGSWKLWDHENDRYDRREMHLRARALKYDLPRAESSLAALRAGVERVIDIADKSYAEAPHFCNKCGFHGEAEEPGIHPNCPYLAVKMPRGWFIYNALKPLRSLLTQPPEPDPSEQGRA